MIVSHKHRFIFLKTKKTAGTSIELALSAVCGRDDIITPLAQPEDEPLRRGLAPQNWRRPGLVPAAWRGMAELFNLSRKAVDFHEHIKAEKARRFLGERVWNSYFKFAVERNPWDRQVSYWQFKMRKLGAKPMTLAEFLETHHANLNSANIYSLDGRLAVDHLVRYEHLAGDLDHVLSHLGIDARLLCPRPRESIGGSATIAINMTRRRGTGWRAPMPPRSRSAAIASMIRSRCCSTAGSARARSRRDRGPSF